MDLLDYEPKLLNLSKINVLIGRNGCGKSTILRTIDQRRHNARGSGLTRYVTPERGGALRFSGNIETNIGHNPNWLTESRRRNRNDSFREATIFEFRRLETLVLRTIEKDFSIRNSSFSFDETIKEINGLLDNIEIRRSHDAGFDIYNKSNGSLRNDVDLLSSGESELISLAIDLLSFCYQVRTFKEKDTKGGNSSGHFLLIDEPDVHIHPDLQHRLVSLLLSGVRDIEVTVLIATHSTAVLSALSEISDASVGFMQKEAKEIQFRPISNVMKNILPIFGAHPLSEVFRKTPILLVEGEDDERIWQSANRRSQGKLRLWPCVAGDKQSLNTYEKEVDEVAGAIYDKPIAYSLRDRDDQPYEIDDKKVVHRMRLKCRTAENLIISDDVLELLGKSWTEIQKALEVWLDNNAGHSQFNKMQEFRDGGWDRMGADIKPLRNLLMERAGSTKPWEVAVGQAIAKIRMEGGKGEEHSLISYLGPKLTAVLEIEIK